jgi:hypothetical protein
MSLTFLGQLFRLLLYLYESLYFVLFLHDFSLHVEKGNLRWVKGGHMEGGVPVVLGAGLLSCAKT